ncbi:hypothetical protein K470DRAFT_260027 [Piedraia hortae CBS 480.64]|uniref:Uncharacterized protein n=1 Tax=Piedraia hortae CBS 480.64 TaxID=1314780 RepID=A0A6A7BSK9_9PEZI|nr:hypothetical protein K470DRAFT_260027 [Piedraia hortae CBS 480.64]
MCFGFSRWQDAETKKSKEIEKQLRDEQRKMQKEVKILLLGMFADLDPTTRLMSHGQERASLASRRC